MHIRRLNKYKKTPKNKLFLGVFFMLLLYSCTTTQVDQIKNVEISQKYFIDVSVKDLSNASGSIDLEYV